MAAFMGVAQRNNVALSAGVAKTVIQLVAPANQRVRIKGWGVAFDGTLGTAVPVLVELVRQSTAGTMSSLTPVKLDDSLAEALQVTAQHTATAEPTTGDVLDTILVHPQTGYEKIYMPEYEPICGGGDRVALRVNAPAGVNVNAKIFFEE